jgi:serine/threonine-protein kinase
MNRAAGPAAGGLSDLAADWPRLNALLDEALSLPAPERAAWLRVLPAEHAALKDTLARLLDVRAGIETGDFLGTLPRLDGAAGEGGEVADPGAAKAGDEVGPYRLVRELGEGGMGSVWLAERADGQLKRQVALKLPRLSWARGLAERMARERDILATLAHPHIARLYDAGVDRLGRPWLALEYVQGRPIDAYAKAEGLTVRQRVELLLQVCEAVAYAHSRLVIHRDLKPSNILVTGDGQVRLLDFGIAKLMQGEREAAASTELTQFAGRALTLRYASPEQVRGEALGTATDVYSLGVVAFEVLAGVGPYSAPANAPAELQASIERGDLPRASDRAPDPPTRLALRGDLDAVLAKALAHQPARRYAGVASLAHDLRRYLDGDPVAARRPLPGERWLRWLRRQRAPLLVGIAALLILSVGLGAGPAVLVGMVAAAGAGVAWRQALLARRGREQAEAAARRAERVRDGLLRVFDLGANPQDGRLAHQMTLKEALDAARSQVTAQLVHLPGDQVVVLEALAAVYEQLDLAAENMALLDEAIAAAERLPPLDEDAQQQRLSLLARRLSAAFFHQRFDGFDRALADFEALLEARGESASARRADAIYYRVRREQMLGGPGPGAIAGRLAEAEAMYARYAPAAPTRQHALALAVQAALAALRLDDAERFASMGIELARRALGESAGLGNALSVRGVVRLRAGRWSGARQDLEAARAEYLRHAGPDHFLTAQNDVYLGHAMVGAGEEAAGLAMARAAAALISRLRRGEVKEAQVLERLGAAELQAGNLDAARVSLSRALEVWRAHPQLAPEVPAETLALQALVAVRLGDAAAARDSLADLEAVLAAASASRGDPLPRLKRMHDEAAAAVDGLTPPRAASPPPAPAAPAGR